jgi:hypothetical protein
VKKITDTDHRKAVEFLTKHYFRLYLEPERAVGQTVF